MTTKQKPAASGLPNGARIRCGGRQTQDHMRQIRNVIAGWIQRRVRRLSAWAWRREISAAHELRDTQDHLDFWWRTEPDTPAAAQALMRSYNRISRERDALLEAAEITLRENAHMANGDTCTFAALKKALPPATN